MRHQGAMSSFIAAAVLFTSLSSQAYIVAGSMGRDPVASEGQCLPKKIDLIQAKLILSRNEITTTANATGAEIIAIARGVAKIEELYGGVFPGIRKARFIFTNNGGVWNQSSGPILVNREWTDGGMNSRNVGMLMHELGHHVANNKREDNPLTYAKYFKVVGENCGFSWYSGEKRTEEFADVFSTFIVHPDNLISYGTATCKKAFDLFRKKVFTKGELAKCPKGSSQKRTDSDEGSGWSF